MLFDFLGRMIIGLLTVTAGFYMAWKPSFFLDAIGDQAWMEKIFGEGRQITGYQFLGVIIALLGLAIITGLHTAILYWIFGPVITALQK